MKKTFVEWKRWQTEPIPEELHNEWKATNAFADGMAIIVGKVWRGLHTGQHLTFIDCDNSKAIEEFCAINGRRGETLSLDKIAEQFIVEQHKDDTNKCHIFFYSEIPFVKKSSDMAVIGSNNNREEEVPAFEVKGQGTHGIAYCTPSIHKNGEHYEIIGTKEPISLGSKPANELMQHLDNICRRYGLQYLENDNGNGKSLIPTTELFKDNFVIYKDHNRHLALLRAMDSLISHNASILSLEEIKELAYKWNQKHCVPPKEDREFEKDWKDATKYIISSSRSSPKKLEEEAASAIVADDDNYDTPGNWLSRQKIIDKHLDQTAALSEEVMRLHTFKTLEDTKEIRFYQNGVYHLGGDDCINTALEKLGGYDVTTNIVREVTEHIKRRTLVPRSEFDKELYLVNCRNCVIDLRSGRTLDHDPTYLFTQQLPVNYRPDQIRTCRKILDFLYNIMHPSDVPLILEFIGYCLIKDCRFQKALMCAGPPDTGKSTFLFLLTAFLGKDNVANKTMQQLTENRFATASLYGKLANVFADLSSNRLKDIAMFKTLVSGDRINAERKFIQDFEFTPFAKLVFSANLPPLPPQGISDEDAFYKRWFVVSFNLHKKCFFCGQEIVKDPNLLEKLTTEDEDELSGLLYLVVKAAQRLLARKRFAKSPTIETVMEEYERKAKPVKAWVEARCIVYEDYETDKDKLERDFEEYCQRKKLPSINNRIQLGRELNLYYRVTDGKRGPRGNQTHVWKGIALRKDLRARGELDLNVYGEKEEVEEE
jgi:P4 family phage/plasmid primase-like protien